MSADYAFQKFMEYGLSPQAAAAAAGAFEQESGFNTKAIHDDGTGYGIAGWRDVKPGEGRKTNLMNWAKANELNPDDLDTQLDYFMHEITSDESKAGQALFEAEDLDSAVAAMVHYERPAGYDESDVTKANGYDNRLSYAKNLLSSYTGDKEIAYGPTGEDAEPERGIDYDDMEDEDYPDDEEDDPEGKEDFGEGEEGEDFGDRLASGVARAGRALESSGDEPLDYTPAGDNMQVAAADDQGIPVDSYRQYTSMYANGGVVGEMSVSEYFKKLGV